MEASCKTCNHWDTQKAPVQQDGFGECEVLSDAGMKYVLPVVQNGGANAEIMTKADFYCNQYES